jgi:tRNA-dihydrouridine synthase A
MMGLRHGLPGARRWRQVWSDHRMKALAPAEVMALAHAPVSSDVSAHVA